MRGHPAPAAASQPRAGLSAHAAGTRPDSVGPEARAWLTGSAAAPSGENRILHNTQWVVGPHVHVAVLVGLTMTLYSFLVNIVMTVGLKGAVGIFQRSDLDRATLVPDATA